MKVIMVDDDNIFLMLHARCVIKAGLCTEPICMNDPSSALEFLIEDMKQNPLDKYLLLLDINMPKINGWQFIDELIASGVGDRVSIAIISSSVNELDKQKASSYQQIISFLEKPLLDTHVASLKEKCFPA